MESNKLIKSVIWGISTVVGLAIAEGIYRSSVNAIERKTLVIGDGEIVSDETETIEELTEEDLPF